MYKPIIHILLEAFQMHENWVNVVQTEELMER